MDNGKWLGIRLEISGNNRNSREQIRKRWERQYVIVNNDFAGLGGSAKAKSKERKLLIYKLEDRNGN